MQKLTRVSCGKWRLIEILLVALSLGYSGDSIGTPSLADQPSTELHIPLIDKGPVLDGDLSDAAWDQAAEIRSFNLLGKSGGTVDQRASVMTDGTWLFIAYEIVHPAPGEIKPAVLRNPSRGLSVVQDDSLEVFIDPGTDGQLYFQFALNAANVSGARRNIRGAAAEQTAGLIPLRHAVKITDKGWNAELAIPLTLLASGGDLARARMNLCINRKMPRQTVAGVTSGHDREHSSWARLSGGYHAPGSFARVHGLDARPIAVPFFPVLMSAEINDYSINDNACVFAVELANAFGEVGTAAVIIRAMQADGQSLETRETFALVGGETRTVTISAPAPETRQVEVEVQDAGLDAVLQTMALTPDQLSGLDLLQAYFDRSYYTAEAEAFAVCQVNVSAGDMAALRVRLRDGVGSEITNAPAAPVVRLAMPLELLERGRHDFSVELYRVEGTGVPAAQALQLEKLAPRPGLEWKIDRVNRVLLQNDAPFFPFGICARISLDDEAGWRELGRAFNCMVSWNRRMDDAEMARSYAAAAAAHDLMFIARAHEFFEPKPRGGAAREKLGYDALTQQQLELVVNVHAPRVVAGLEPLLEMANAMGCFVWDEPRYHQYDHSAPGRALNDIVKRADAYRPTFVNYAAYIPEGDKYTDWFDVLMTDPYWIPGGPAHIGTPNWVSRRTYEINLLAAPARFRQPIMIVPMAEYWSGTLKRAILPMEQRAQTYLALIHGAKGIIYWLYPVVHQLSFDIFSELGAEMQKLGPVIVAPDVPQQITYTPQPFDPSTDTYPDVQVALHRDPAGGYVLLAANSRAYPVDVSYQLAGLADGAAISQMFGTGQITVTAGAFADRLAGYDTRAYAFDEPAQWGADAPVMISVEAAGDTAAYIPEQPAYPVTGRSGKKNLLPNSSFEECALPGWPNYTGIMPHKQITTVNRTGGPAPFFQAVSDNPFHGEKCLLITPDQSPEDRARVMNRDGIRIKISPRENAPREYVFSAWMRANREGVKASLFFTGWRSSTFELSTEWRRYSVQGVVKPGSDRGDFCYILAGATGREPDGNQPGDMVWVDAIQLERGTEPTEYEP